MATSTPGSICTVQFGSEPHRDPFASIAAATLGLVYSKSKDARWKRVFDEQLAASGLRVAPSSGLYWKALISGVASMKTCPEVDGLQFFLIRGGYEGFLAKNLVNVDANRVNWDGRKGTTDLNDALVVFDSAANLVGAFQLAVPNYHPATSPLIASDWDGRPVFSYYNDYFKYQGLAVLDRGKLPEYDPKMKRYTNWIDIHHAGGTLGCIEVAGAALSGTANFDSFVAGLGTQYGQDRTEQYLGSKSAYFRLGTPIDGGSAETFDVHMPRFLGRILVLDIPP